MTQLLDGLLNVPTPVVLVLVFALPAAEASTFLGIVFPGEIAILLGGVLANEGKVLLWLVVLLGFLGAAAGDSLGYEVGRRYGRRLLAKLPSRLVRPQHLDRAERLVRERGGRAVFIGRFTASLRALIPGMAGMSRLPYGRFLVFNVAGAATWAGAVAVTGYAVGRSYRTAEHRLSLISVGLLLAVAGWLLYRLLRHSSRVHEFAEAHLGWLLRFDAKLVWALAVLGVAAWLFAGLAQDVTAHDGVAADDRALLDDVIDRRQVWVTPVARAVTAIGTGPPLYALLLAAGWAYWRRRRSWRVPAVVVVLLGSGQLVRLALNIGFAVPRPPSRLWLTDASGYAFPSGHTASATIGYGLAAFLLARADPVRRPLYAVTAALLAAAVGLSRVYLGVHWPSDVLGGWAFGVLWLALAATVAAALPRRVSGAAPS